MLEKDSRDILANNFLSKNGSNLVIHADSTTIVLSLTEERVKLKDDMRNTQ